MTSACPAPVIRITRGLPEPGEVAAVIAALVAARSSRGQVSDGPAVPASGWADRSRLVRATPRPGPQAWRASAWPR